MLWLQDYLCATYNIMRLRFEWRENKFICVLPNQYNSFMDTYTVVWQIQQHIDHKRHKMPYLTLECPRHLQFLPYSLLCLLFLLWHKQPCHAFNTLSPWRENQSLFLNEPIFRNIFYSMRKLRKQCDLHFVEVVPAERPQSLLDTQPSALAATFTAAMLIGYAVHGHHILCFLWPWIWQPLCDSSFRLSLPPPRPGETGKASQFKNKCAIIQVVT